MSIDFSTLQGLTIPEGVVTQIADESGRVIWAVSGGKVILQVEKITSDTYAGETTYTGEQFILLDIYPKTNGIVKVTYGGLTKTIMDTSGAAKPNAQQVFFGTFNGVSDSVTTPASGELTIEGDYYAFGCGSYNSAKASFALYGAIVEVMSFGASTEIPAYAFSNILAGASCEKIKKVNIPDSIEFIGECAFQCCIALESVNIPASVTKIGNGAFCGNNHDCFVTVDTRNANYKIDGNCLVEIATNKLVSGFKNSKIPSYITTIGNSAFYKITELTSITIPSSVTDINATSFTYCSGLITVNMLATTPPKLGSDNVFSSTTCSIIVPKGCGEAYKTTENWLKYADRIVEAS